MAQTQSVLFLSCSETSPDDVIKLLIGDSELPEKILVEENVYAFPWTISNKYYRAEVNLCSVQKKTISNKAFYETVQAIVLHFDSYEKNGMDKVESWLPFINEYDAEIKILLCKNIKSDNENMECNKRNVQEWCIAKGFELVELEPVAEEHEIDDLEDDFTETTGIERVIQALNAHVWPNLIMKEPDLRKSTIFKKPYGDESKLSNIKLNLEESLEELLENDDDFSSLFSQLSEIKARISSLSGEERKAAAEEVVHAFWKALGEDEDEFLDV